MISSGLQGQRHGDHDALAHAAGELVRIVAHPLPGGRDATRSISSTALARASFFDMPRCTTNISPSWSPTVSTGFRDDSASWKIIAISAPADLAALVLLELQQVPALEEDLARR